MGISDVLATLASAPVDLSPGAGAVWLLALIVAVAAVVGGMVVLGDRD